MTLPLHILRRWIKPGGVRLAPWPKEPDDIAGPCAACGKPVVRKVFMGVRQLDGVYRGAEFFHYQCQPRNTRPWEYYGKKGGKVKIPMGNLAQEEYRFWVGVNAPVGESKWGQCRCCKTVTYGADERLLHFQKREFLVNGDSCTTRLVNAYKELLGGHLCIVCRGSRFNYSKWGVPLCAKIECETAWKFDQQRHMSLEVILHKQQKTWEAAEETRTLKDTKYTTFNTKPGTMASVTDKDGKTTFRPWCNACRMFADNATHGEIHAARVVSGQIADEA